MRSTLALDSGALTTHEPRAAVSGSRCQVCGTRIVVEGEHDVVVKNAILRIERATGRVTAKCPRCKAWVQVPLRYVG